jgi:hypothetical protein
MTPILLDSDVLIEVGRGRDQTIFERWTALSESASAVLCSPVTVAEIWHGARPSEHSSLEALFGTLVCVTIDDRIGRKAGEYLAKYGKGHGLELGDALIAATASLHPAQLWTRNRKHYPMRDVEFY